MFKLFKKKDSKEQKDAIERGGCWYEWRKRPGIDPRNGYSKGHGGQLWVRFPTCRRDLYGNVVLQNPKILPYLTKVGSGVELTCLNICPSLLESYKVKNEDTKIYLVQNDPDLIRYFDNPSKDLQMVAVKNNLDSYRHIKNPHKETEIFVKKRLEEWGELKNQADELGLNLTFEGRSEFKDYFSPSQKERTFLEENPSEPIIEQLCQDPLSIRKFKELNEDLEACAILSDPMICKYHTVRFENSKKLMAHINPFLIEYIEDPSEETQLIAVIKNPYALKYIQKPTDKVRNCVNKLKEKEEVN